MAQPALIPAVYVLGIAAFLCGGIWLSSSLSGWRALAESYSCSSSFEGQIWHMRLATILRSWFWRYHLQVSVGANERGLYIKLWPFRLPFYPPLFFPWADVSAEWGPYMWNRVEFRFREEPGVKIRLSQSTTKKIVAAAGDAWPDGQFLFTPLS